MKRYTTRTLAAAVCGGVLAITACTDSTGPGLGVASVVLSGDAVAASLVDETVGLNLAGVPESAVSNLFLTITRVDVHLAGGDDGGAGEAASEGVGDESSEGGSWFSLDLTLTEPLDLLALSTAGLQLAQGTVPAGKYTQARFFFETSELVLGEQVVVNGVTLDPGTYDVDVPSAEQTGLKLLLSGMNVDAGDTETVEVEVGAGATIGTLVWNSNGFAISPVLSTK